MEELTLRYTENKIWLISYVRDNIFKNYFINITGYVSLSETSPE